MRYLFIVIITTFTIVTQNAVACELHIGWEHFYPFLYKDDSTGKLTGLDIELLSAILNQMPCKAKYSKTLWKAHLQRLKNGTLDIASSASFTKERNEYAYFSEPYREETVSLFVLKGSSKKYKFTKLSDIIGQPFLLGVTKGYYYGDEFEELSNNPDFKQILYETSNNIQHIKMLQSNRINGFLMDNVVAKSIIMKENMQDKIEAYPMEVHSSHLHIMFSRKSVAPEIVNSFNSVLKSFKTSEKYRKIIKKYYGE